jgi:hypothetical protein
LQIEIRNFKAQSLRKLQKCLVLMSVEDAEAGLLTGLEHFIEGGCDLGSGRFVDDEWRFPGEGFVGGLYAQTKSASCHEGQKDSADDKGEGPAGNGVAAWDVFEEGEQEEKSGDDAQDNHK